MNENMVENSVQTPEPVASTDTKPVEQVNQATMPKPDRTFTRDEVTTILRKRLERANSAMFSKYGVKDKVEFEALLQKAKDYDSLKQERDSYSEKVAFLSNDINPDRYDDVRIHFKGKGLSFTEDLLKQELLTHPEWLRNSNKPTVTTKPKITVSKIGTEQTAKPTMTDKARAEKIFGFKL